MTTSFPMEQGLSIADCFEKIDLDDLLSEFTDDLLKDDTGQPAPKLDPKSVRTKYRMGYVKTFEQIDASRLFLEGPPYIDGTVSTAPFKTLRRTRISDLSVNVRAKGTYLLARVIEVPTIHFRLSTIIEDHTGDVFHFCVYNFVNPETIPNPNDVLPVGTIFILKEPLLILPETARYTIRCNSPTDIIVLFKQHKLYHLGESIKWTNKIDEAYVMPDPTSSNGWKELGDERFSKDMFFKSIEAYSMALKAVESHETETKAALYSSISSAYFKLQYYESALLYASRALELTPNDTKPMFTAARAHYELRQFEEGNRLFKHLVQLEPHNKEYTQEHTKCETRIEEQNGKVHIYKTYFNSILKPKTEADCADYSGPIKIAPILGKGRGVVATEAIKPGTLISVSKAIATQFYDILEAEVDEKNSQEQAGIFSSRFGLLPKLTQLALKNPTVYGSLLFSLSTSDGTTIRNIFCDEKKEEITLDTEHIHKIIETNYFAINSSVDSERQGVGLFCSHSYFNHDCLFNSWLETYNNVMIIHAIKFIDCGEEITVTYNKALTPFLDRETNGTSRKFQCLCSLCELDRKEEIETHEDRRYLAEKSDCLWLEYRNNQNFEEAVAEMSEIISQLERTYAGFKRYQLRYALCLPHTRLAAIYLDSGQPQKSMKELEMSLNSLGLSSKDLFEFEDHGKPFPQESLFTTRILDIAELAALSCLRYGRPWDAKKWLGVLLSLEKMCTGGNIHMVREKYKNAAFREIEFAVT